MERRITNMDKEQLLLGNQQFVASLEERIKEVSFIKNKFPSYKGEVIAMIYDLKDGRVSIL